MPASQLESSFSNLPAAEKFDLLNLVMENIPDCSIIVEDLMGTILALNPFSSQLYGYPASELVGKSAMALYAPYDANIGNTRDIYEGVKQTDKWQGQIRYIRKNGTQFNALVVITLRKDNKGLPVGFMRISKDLSQGEQQARFVGTLKDVESTLVAKNEILEETIRETQRSDRLKSEFLVNISHEMRTPLTGIIGFAELMHGEKLGPLTPSHKEYLSYILSSSHHLLLLLNDILDLAKIESGKIDFSPVSVDLKAFMLEATNVFKMVIAKKNIDFDILIDDELKHIIIDPTKLKQIVYNYLSNAVKFTHENGQISIYIRPDKKNSFRLEVKDTGIGIRKEDLNRLFIAFQQLDAGIAKKYAGTGLGLALTKRLVEAQGGKVGVTSEYGKGSIFYAILPYVSENEHYITKRNIK